jgi:hydroxymethylglutaryl-CoA reductase
MVSSYNANCYMCRDEADKDRAKLMECLNNLCEDHKKLWIAKLETENKRLQEALEWYAENVGNCNKDGDEGNTARNRLAKDVGSIANAALED